MGRQKMRAELAAAVTDGDLSPREQYRMILKAKQVLSPSDFEGFQRTLDRVASKGNPLAGDPSPRLASLRSNPRGMIGSEDDGRTIGASYENAEVIPRGEGTPFQDEPALDPMQYGVEGCDDCGGGLGLLGDDGAFFDRVERRGGIGFEAFSSVDAFKGPMDFGTNGNFGVRFGVNGGIPISQRLGIGLQGGTSATLADFHGIPFDVVGVPSHRTQQFVTVGLFQRLPTAMGDIGWGFAYDWLFDDYLANLTFGQWRVKLAYGINPCNEVGIWAGIRDRGDSFVAELPDGSFSSPFHFRPLTQGNIYWRHTWMNDANLTGRLGIAGAPGAMIIGADGSVPITPRLAAVSSFNYFLPSARGINGQAEEIWNISVGLQFVPGGQNRCSRPRFMPLLPVADNGSFAIREVIQPQPQ